MSTLRFILGDQLSHDISALSDLNKENDVVFMCEVVEEITYVKHHKQKIILVLSAMRHFADELKAKGVRVHYVKLTDPDNSGSFISEFKRALAIYQPQRVILTEPSEFRVAKMVRQWQADAECEIQVLPDQRFLCTHAEFASWAKTNKQLRMEYFYREMRKKYHILIDEDEKPIGGKWNFDKENRSPLKDKISIPARKSFSPDPITQDVIALVNERFHDHFGASENFSWAVTRADALIALDEFIKKFLPVFGDYQDAMQLNEVYLFHSVLSPYINIGLLLPLEICQKAEAAYQKGRAPINAVEGFIRQIIGWREYVRGVYWLKMPEYAEQNYFDAHKKLPGLYWGAKTNMNCMREVVRQTHEYAYSHHIQRLMVTGNFALLAGLDPKEVCEWYLIVYADAFDWVELPNTLGMALYGDGGVLGSKPYAASGKYIHRMSNFCQGCQYDPAESVGDTACPFNYLYWHFMDKNQKLLRKNQRLTYTYANWDKMSEQKKQAILEQAEVFLDELV